jgi:hypothetical protein
MKEKRCRPGAIDRTGSVSIQAILLIAGGRRDVFEVRKTDR